MSNLIASRIADFLNQYPPFSDIDHTELMHIAEKSSVRYGEKGEYIFRQGDQGLSELFVVKEGKVVLERVDEENKPVMVDVCDEGDVFGVRAMLSGNPYVFHARCDEESLIYALPVDHLKKVMETNSRVALFFASGLAGGSLSPITKKSHIPIQKSGTLLNWNRPLKSSDRDLIYCNPGTSLREAAAMMETNNTGSILICHEDQIALGIITNTDFRKMISNGDDVRLPVENFMQSPVHQMSLNQPLSAYLITMLKHKVRHVCLTSEGKAVGMVSDRDLMASHQNHPVSLAFAMEESTSVEKLIALRNQADDMLAFYLEQNVSITLTTQLATHLNDVLIRKAIMFAVEEMKQTEGNPPVPFAWLSLGSEGRQEQIIKTDQDNAIVFQDGDDLDKSTAYFRKLGKRVNEIINMAGFEYCPAEMMARNEKWSQPLSVWKEYFGNWILKPDEKSLMFCSIFFDFRCVFGEKELVRDLREFIAQSVGKERIFLNFLAVNALKNPAPLSFFRNFIIERSGEHKDEFDLKARGMMPLTDIARVLSLDYNQAAKSNTVLRYMQLMEFDPANRELYKRAAESYKYLLQFRAKYGFKHQSSGRFIPISSLTKIERQILRNTFEPIDELQKLIEVRYQLNYFRK